MEPRRGGDNLHRKERWKTFERQQQVPMLSITTQSGCRYVRGRQECMQRQLTETELTCGWSEQRRVFSREQEGPWRAFIVHPGYKHFYLRLKHAMGVHMCELFQQVVHFMWNERCIHSQTESIRSCFTALAGRGQSRRSLSLG